LVGLYTGIIFFISPLLGEILIFIAVIKNFTKHMLPSQK